MSTPFDGSMHPRADDGKFAPKEHAESDVSLTASDDEFAAVSGPIAEESYTPVSATSTSGVALARRATGAQLWNLIGQGDAHTLTEVVASNDLSGDQIVALAEHTQPVLVRRQVAQLPHSGVADLVSHDPDVFVRMSALEGWDLSPANRQRLMSDPVVAKMRRIVAASH